MSEYEATYSVVIPAYKASGSISRALISVVKQNLKPLEVIIIDDASDDFETLMEEVDKFNYQSIRIRVFQNEQNVNAAASRNRGICSAKGSYIAFLDADDEWDQDKLSIIDKNIRSKGSGYLYFSRVSVCLDGKKVFERPNIEFKALEHISEYLFLRGGFIQTSTIVISTDMAKKVKFDERFRRHQDYDFCLRAFSLGLKFCFVDMTLGNYYVNRGIFRAKNEDVNYCLWWLSESKKMMSRKGYYGYKLFNLSGRLWLERRYLKLLINSFVAVLMLGPLGIWRAKGKIYFILKNVLKI